MELTPKVFRDVQFREKLRGGYHPEDVDEFLEQAAVAAEELLERLQRAEARAQRAEQSLQDVSANDETLKRVLFMAQRTADQAVREAREEAERLLAEARIQAQTIVSEAEERGRRAYDSKVADARANLERAEAALRRAESDAGELSKWVEVNRAYLIEALREAAAAVEKIGLAEETPAPRSASHFGGPGQPAGGPQQLEEPPEGARDAPGTLAAQSSTADPSAPEAGSEWDPHFLDNLESDPPSGLEPHKAVAGQGAEDTQPGVDRPGWGGTLAHRPEAAEEATVAFDERALENFFSDRDLGPERGSRFRRRS